MKSLLILTRHSLRRIRILLLREIPTDQRNQKPMFVPIHASYQVHGN